VFSAFQVTPGLLECRGMRELLKGSKSRGRPNALFHSVGRG